METDVAWLWTDTLADLLETIDRVEPEALRVLRNTRVAYRLSEDGDPVQLARSVLDDLSGPATTRPGNPQPGAPGLHQSNHPA